MSIAQIIVLAIAALLVGALRKGRPYLMLAVSVIGVYWLQPAVQLLGVNRGFWVSSATLMLAVLGWALTAHPEARTWRRNWPAFGVIAAAVLLVDLSRYVGLDAALGLLTPRFQIAIAFLILLFLLGLVFSALGRRQNSLITLATLGLLFLFVAIKAPALPEWAFSKLANRFGAPAQGEVFAFSWLGFSYLAFRLLHTFRDRQTGRLPALTLDEYLNYAIFFPAFSAGPIDRAERFLQDLKNPLPLDSEGWLFAGRRLFVGLFKKFVLADALSFFALNEVFALQVSRAGWMWLLVYAYAFQIFLDFSGYTDVAIGLGRLMGIRLPENFASPYLKPNLTQFWNSWHMTLTQWFRAYYFNPLTRALRTIKRQPPAFVTIFVTQVSTMLLIGLWHGISWNFVLWGAWHGIGLFLQNRWSEFFRSRLARRPLSLFAQRALHWGGVVLTFHYVALGWVFFVLPASLAARVMGILFGMGG